MNELYNRGNHCVDDGSENQVIENYMQFFRADSMFESQQNYAKLTYRSRASNIVSLNL